MNGKEQERLVYSSDEDNEESGLERGCTKSTAAVDKFKSEMMRKKR